MKRLILITCLLFITGLMNNVFAVKQKVVDGVTYIHNTDKPKFNQPTIELKEEWRIGGEDPGFIFNSPVCIDVDDDGRILVTDILEYDVKIFSSTGKFEKEFGVKGNGPGEFDFNMSVVSLAKDKILVIDSRIARPYSRFNYFNYDGIFIDNEDILLDANTSAKVNNNESYGKLMLESRTVFDARLVDENLLIQVDYAHYTDKEECQAIYWLDLKKNVSREVDVRTQKSAILNADNMQKQDDRTSTEILWCENKNNTIAVIPDLYDFRIFIYNNSGTLLKVTSRDFTRPLKSKNEFEASEKEAQNYMKLMAKHKLEFNVLKYKSIISNKYEYTHGLFYDDNERLWVLTNESFDGQRRNAKENIDYFYSFDIFDAQGEYLMRMPIKTHSSARDFKYKNGFLYFFDRDNEGYLWLVKIRVVDRTK